MKACVVESLEDIYKLQPDFPCGWKVRVSECKYGDAVKRSYLVSDERRGSIIGMGVKEFEKGNTWDQPVFFEKPGEVYLPVMQVPTKQGKRWLIGLVTVFRPVMLQSDGQTYGVLSLEAPRGIGEGLAKRDAYRPLAIVGRDDISSELEEETRLVPASDPLAVGPINPNSSYFATSPPSFVVQIDPASIKRFPKEGIARDDQGVFERIISVSFYQWPEEIRSLMLAQERDDVTFWCAFTQALILRFALYYDLVKP